MCSKKDKEHYNIISFPVTCHLQLCFSGFLINLRNSKHHNWSGSYALGKRCLLRGQKWQIAALKLETKQKPFQILQI